ncbi:MAG: tetratricopeptide repeat protein [Planctomycetes bacterium]|nr:tetratricopeptide repeat protein [Planctomycetota bacterium]
MKALEKNPERRYPSAVALAADLRRFLRYEPIQARAQSAWTRLARRALKHKGRVAAIGTILVLILTLGFVFFEAQYQARLRREAAYEPAVLEAAMKMQVAGLSMMVASGYLSRIERHVMLLRGGFRVLSRELGRGPVERAVAALGEAEAIFPRRADAYYHRARGLLLLEKEAEAGEELERALACNPRLVPALLLRSELKERHGDLEGARLDQDWARAAGEAGWGEAWPSARREIEAGRWKEAAEAYGKLIKIERAGSEMVLGSLVEALLGRGIARLEGEDFSEAIEDFLEAKIRMPDSIQPALLLGKAYYLMGRKGRAEEVFQELHQRSELKDDLALEVAGVYFIHHDWARMREWVEKMKEVSAVRERNRAWFLPRGAVEALEAAQRAVRLDPGDPMAHCILGLVYSRQGNRAEVENMAQKALALGRENAYVRHMVSLVLLSDAGEKIEGFHAAIRLDPDLPWPHEFLGELLHSRGEREAGYAAVRRAIELDPKSYAPYTTVF